MAENETIPLMQLQRSGVLAYMMSAHQESLTIVINQKESSYIESKQYTNNYFQVNRWSFKL